MTSEQHAIDKREQDSRKKAAWVPLDPIEALPAPDSTGPVWGEKQGISFRLIGGVLVPCKPSELYELREKLRREHTTYRGRMMRGTRECWVPRKLSGSPVETTNLTLPPWTQAAIRSRPRSEQEVLVRRISARLAKLAGKTKRQVVGFDWHGDTDKLHCELHTLRLDPKTGRLLEMPVTTTWHLGQDRLFRHGLEDPKSEEKAWREAAEKKRGLTIDLEMTRAIDEEVASWLREHKLEKETEIRKRHWLGIAKAAKEKRILAKAASLAKAYAIATGAGLLSGYAMRRIKELMTHKERDAEIDRQLRTAVSMDRVN